MLVLVTGSLYYASSAAGARPQTVSVAPAETRPQVYCVYQYQFLVVEVQATPGTTQAGATVDVLLKVQNLDGTPATLNPAQGDFLLLGSNHSHVYEKVTLTPTGNPGEYRTSIVLASDIPMGYYKLYCVHCTLTDGNGNYAPNSDISSDETADTSDLSGFIVGAATAITTTGPFGGFLTSLIVGLGILVLIVIIIAALLLRPRKKKT